jgi:DNA-binding winged helix-turn-helix (wHTH) protein
LQQELQEKLKQAKEINEQMQKKSIVFGELCTKLLRAMSINIHVPDTISGRIRYMPEQAVPEEQKEITPTLYAVCLAPFELHYLGMPLTLCSNRNGQAILRYLIVQAEHSATSDTLMALFWPDDSTEVALRKLQVSISLLRRCLQTGHKLQGSHILYKQHVYQLSPAVAWHSDVEEFLALYKLGSQEHEETALVYYEKACALYTHELRNVYDFLYGLGTS